MNADTRTPIYAARRPAERCAELQGVWPIRLFAILLPLWQAEIRAQVNEGQPYDLMDKFVEQAVAHGRIDTAQGLADFLGLDLSLVHRVLHFLDLIGHIAWQGDRVALTELGLRSLRDDSRYVRKESRLKLLFDGITMAPLPRDYYSGDVVVLPVPEYRPKYGPRFLALSSGVLGGEPYFRPDAVWQLTQRRDRELYNLPHELRDSEIVAVRQVYLPVYLVDALLPGGQRGHIAFSQVPGERDHLVERLVAGTPVIHRALEAEDTEDPAKLWGKWLTQRGLSASALVRLPNGGWRAVLPATRFGEDGPFRAYQLGSFENHQRYFLQLWCDDPAARRATVLQRGLSMLQRRDITTSADLAGQLAVVSRQLEVDTVTVTALRDYATRSREYDRVRRIDTLA